MISYNASFNHVKYDKNAKHEFFTTEVITDPAACVTRFAELYCIVNQIEFPVWAIKGKKKRREFFSFPAIVPQDKNFFFRYIPLENGENKIELDFVNEGTDKRSSILSLRSTFNAANAGEEICTARLLQKNIPEVVNFSQRLLNTKSYVLKAYGSMLQEFTKYCDNEIKIPILKNE